jgi:hypothetical protein
LFLLDNKPKTRRKGRKGIIEIVTDEEPAAGAILWPRARIAMTLSIDVLPESVEIRQAILPVHLNLLHNLSPALVTAVMNLICNSSQQL